MKRKPYRKEDFNWVRWTPKDIKRIAEYIIEKKKERYAKIKAIPAAKRTFANTIYALEASGDDLADDGNKIGLLKNVSPDKAIRDAAGAAEELLSSKLVDIEFDKALYQAVKDYAKKKEKLTGPNKLLFRDMLRGYTRMGFDLPEAKQKKLKANLKKLGELGIKFDQNLNEYKDHITVTNTELEGLPEHYKQMLKRDKQGRYLVSLDYPEYVPFMAGSESEKFRKELMEKALRKGGKTNLKLLKQMLNLRDEDARLLGFKNHADLQTELRMAKSGKNVGKFLNDLERRTRVAGIKDRELLARYKRELRNNPKAQLKSYDVAYLFKRLKKERFDIDSDVVKEHFPFEHVKNATLAAYQKLLGVRFERRNDIKLWHEDVQLYDVFDAKTKEYLASFGLDLYPRDGKYGHAAVFDGIYGRQEGDRYIAPYATMVTNFPKPSATNPSLMSHREVETFFHEFGHVVHFTLTKAKYYSQSGFHTSQDFVEAPSQMLENWVWNKEMLRSLSKHYKTGKPLPDDLIDRMIGAKLLGEAWATRGQLVIAMLDLMLHSKKVKNPNQLYATLERKLINLDIPKTQMWLAGFGHIAHGYDAGYYGYMWSKVYAEDMFTRFEKEGILNPKTGRDYRTWILEKGSSMEEMDLLKGFLGRKPNNKAFLKSIGVK